MLRKIIDIITLILLVIVLFFVYTIFFNQPTTPLELGLLETRFGIAGFLFVIVLIIRFGVKK